MKLVCEFIGGRWHGKYVPLEIGRMEADGDSGFNPSSKPELNHKPTFVGYLGPMWDGLRYEVGGKIYYEHDLKYRPELKAEVEAKNIQPFGVLRYETQRVYDAMSR